MRTKTLQFSQPARRVYTSVKRAVEKCGQFRHVASFFSVLDQLHPDLLIVWGKRLWDNLPSERWQDGEAVNVEGYSVQNGYYLLQDGGRVRTFCVYHPSTGYDWAYWHKVIKKVNGDG